MTTCTTEYFDRQYQTHLKLKGLQPKTIDAYARAIRRLGDYFGHQIDDLSEALVDRLFQRLDREPLLEHGQARPLRLEVLPGSSNNQFRSWLASRSRSNLNR